MKQLLEKLLAGQSLTRREAAEAMAALTSGATTPAQTAAFLTVYQLRLGTAPEILGFQDTLLQQAAPFAVDIPEAVDLCGTGGDGKDTFNISTLAALTVAAAGYPVIKHGNYGFSATSGSSDLVAALGIPLPSDAQTAQKIFSKHGIVFLHAPFWHPTLSRVAGVRKELGFRTVFNLLGPLINPANPPFQLVGVFSRSVQDLYARVLRERDRKYAIVHSDDGYDEISLTGPATIISRRGALERLPADYGLAQLRPEELFSGGSRASAKRIAIAVISGTAPMAQLNVVAANAAEAITLLRPTENLQTLCAATIELLRSGRVAELVKSLGAGA